VYAFAPLDQITEELFHQQFNLNVLGLLLTTKEASKYFNGDGGSVINISSAVTTLYPPGSATYTATKAAVDAITVILSKELGPKGIRVNAINPGMIDTEGVQSAGFLGSDFEKGIVAQTPLGRIGQPDDISPAAVFLASSESKYMTGQTVNISGGLR
jgi:3-oxoacyl-[acyl-carrier protein] reductase